MSLKILSSLLLGCCLVLPAVSGHSAQNASVPAPAGAVGVSHGPGGMGFPVGKFCAVANYRYAHKDEWYLHTSEEDGADKEVSSHNIVFKTRYGIAKGWDIRTATPFLMNTIETDGKNDAWSGGLGDTTAILRNQFMSQKDGAPLSLALDLGMFVPTGEVGQNNIGTGAWGGLVGAGATWMIGSHRLETDLSYLIYTEGKKEVTKGDRLRVNGHYAYALNNRLDLGLEGYYEWTQADEIDGVNQKNEVKTFFAGPKFNLKFPEYGVTLGGVVLGAVYREYEKQTLTEDWRAEFKLIKLF